MGEGIDYQEVMQGALRGVVRQLLERVAAEGLPGKHHFYIGFRTGDEGVVLPKSLRSRYPKEMTIVLQNQFWGLEIDDDRFSVSLHFGGKPADLTIPFTSLTSFVDPSVPFGLRFDFDLVEGVVEGESASDAAGPGPAGISPTPAPALHAAEERGAEPSPGQVVSIDEFRRKD